MSDREKVINDLQTQIEELEERLAIVLEWQPEIVRCKDCKHGKLLFPDYVSCLNSEENESGCHVSHRPDWFCADGERR